jgi:hypothetical protein
VSSAGFEAGLVPTRWARRFLVLLSAGATLTGILLILDLPLLPAPKVLFGALWLGAGLAEARAQFRGMRRICRFRISADGSLEGQAPDGGIEAIQLTSGSVVLARMAWLRVRFSDGTAYGELLTGDGRVDDDWHRLQLVWRQRASTFGGPRGS